MDIVLIDVLISLQNPSMMFGSRDQWLSQEHCETENKPQIVFILLRLSQ